MSPSQLAEQFRNLLLNQGSGGQLVLVILIIVVAVSVAAAIIASLKRGDQSEKLEELLKRRAANARVTDSSVWITRIVISVILVGAFVAANAYASRPQTCAQCHRTNTYTESVEQSPHAQVSCMQCHMPAGVGGVLQQGVTYTRWIVVYGVTKKAPEPKAGSVGSGSCLRCHAKVAKETVTANGIRVRHSDFLDAGAECRECHNSTAHPNAVKEPSRPSMDKCLPCHDGEKAPSECETCHVKDSALKPLAERGYAPRKVSGGPDSCYRCHDEKPCVQCHGVRMPHPPGWSPSDKQNPGYGHARDGFANREVCWRCHFAPGKPFQPADEGCSCHGLLGKVHGGKPWVKEHGLQATGKRSGANQDCFSCHSQDLCSRCHPASYRDKFAPNGAAPTSPGYVAPSSPELMY